GVTPHSLASRFLRPAVVHLAPVHRRPLASTLFPYTTLFRSYRYRGPAHSSRCRRGRCRCRIHRVCSPSRGRPSSSSGRRGGCSQDRKSTRLNSSHVSISYAVFCLKKKTTRPLIAH